MSQYSYGGVPSGVPGQTNLFPSRSYLSGLLSLIREPPPRASVHLGVICID